MVNRFGGGMIRYGLPGMVMGVILSWAAGMHGPMAEAQTGRGADGPARGMESSRGLPQAMTARGANGEAGGTIAMVTSPPGSYQWLYLVDTRMHALAVYRLDPSNPKGALKLEAARQYQWDLKLEHYNNQAPEPAAIESMVKALTQPPR
ncbi:hypothetical protein OJF2_64620 [Aquisphaera giovannonii]|uniref:Uncharacterized protein n=1 Tax=Aquisphaera giovannonii TaxID=406548 RepID=A0A5B9WDB7_9BACT|nr:hypothetical protein [Aquisphaera giovannonii]QEH37870.1 hypothetical protein OJF2_64620 [Aquisphaera giovannonii]